MRKLILTFFAILMACHSASAEVIKCLPSPVGTGTPALFKSVTKGDFAAWYCPDDGLPTVLVCLKANCGLVGTKRAIATFVSNPTLDGLNAAMAPYMNRNPYTDAELRAVWVPYASEILKVAE